ncbi:hypothetical protein HanHA300_Chr14g0532111 [Helianthus annuus]|nr:hypothetical protein HanHA300_Chr14g0532111 [Helianthus annuus]KAJ0486459.1 hypothetical protein HanHA89_Chr14g0579911 [Helianthus annuus]KAJ0657024.1 hypothetical protein HanLR1_Chr14g0542481 [Helianthus annuus]
MGFPGLGNGIEGIRLNRIVHTLLLDYHTIVLGCAGHIRKTYVYICCSLSSGCEGYSRKTYVNLYSLLPRLCQALT